MPTLAEIKTEGNSKVLIYGPSGSGKTVAGASFPYPMLYLDFDSKVDSAALFYRNDKERLAGIDVRELGGSIEANPMTILNKIISEELIPQQRNGEMKYKTIVLDSLTTFSSLTLDHIIKSNPGVKRVVSKQGSQPNMADYGILRREFQKLIPGILSLPCNVVMIGHVTTEKDEATGQIWRGPHMDGSFARDLPIYFKEVYHAHVDNAGKYLWQTKSNAQYTCRSQIPGLPNPCPASYEEIAKYL